MKKYKRVLLPIVVILGSIFCAMILVLSRPKVETVAPEVTRKLVEVIEVRRQPVKMLVKSQGTVSPRTESALVAQVAGQIMQTSQSFVNGGFFEKGDILVSIDKSDYQFMVAQSKSQVAQAEVALKLEEQEAKVAKQEWQSLNTDEVPPLVAREPQLLLARANLEAAKASLLQAELNLSRTQIKAPYAGRVRAKNSDIGQYITPGMTIGNIYAVDYVEIRLPLPDHELPFLGIPFDFSSVKSGRKGPEVTLKTRFAGKDHAWQGHIARIEGEIDARSRMIYAVARVENPYARSKNENRPPLAVGMFVNAEIVGKTEQSLFQIPRSALRDDDRILIVDAEETLRFRSVSPVRLASDIVYIDSELNDGELVCISPLAAVVEGMPVTIFEDDSNLQIQTREQ